MGLRADACYGSSDYTAERRGPHRQRGSFAVSTDAGGNAILLRRNPSCGWRAT
jgi:hypothetical protein